MQAEVLQVLDDALQLKGRSASFSAETPLLGALPELDSVAVVELIAGLEARFGFTVEDEDVEGRHFATVASLMAFVAHKLGRD